MDNDICDTRYSMEKVPHHTMSFKNIINKPHRGYSCTGWSVIQLSGISSCCKFWWLADFTNNTSTIGRHASSWYSVPGNKFSSNQFH